MRQPLSPTAPPLAGRPILSQRWRDLVFLHWRVPVERVAHLVPVGTVPDTHDGDAWVGLIPFRLLDAAPGRLPGVPWFGSFAETNVRTYSVDGDGRRGVAFRSLDAQRLAVVLGARAVFALPYTWARMVAHRDGDVVEYASRRRWPGPRGAGGTVRVRLGAPLTQPDPLATFLTARWGLHTRVRGRLRWVPNEHERWPLHRAELLHLDDSLVAAAGLEGVVDRPPDSVLASPGVTSRFGAPVPARELPA
ncbi:YqjF family protein [Aquipuribacter sp. SD81]|uniref:YqjF family protein n=1 Tax=Aquipuribacter sp. SD81 TaxID=3127703 RepID=UPI0030185800